MDSQKRVICRVCFKIQDDLNNVKALEEDLKDVLEKVLRNSDLAAIQYPVICTSCADTLKKCFDFKTKCMNTHDYISSFINKDTAKLDLIDVYMNKHENGTGVTDVHDVCGLCMCSVENCSALFVKSEKDIALRKMIEQCVPEVDMNIIQKPVICLPCRESLENCFRFLANCLIAEEKMKYCESQDIDGNVGMDQNSLLQFAIIDIAENLGDSSTDFIKVENQFYEEIGNADGTKINNGGGLFKLEQMSCDDRENYEELELNSESYMDTDDLKFNTAVKIEEPFCGENTVKEENLSEMEDHKCVPYEEVDIKTDESDFNRFEDGILPEPKVSQGDLKTHLLMHQDPSELPHKCDSCSFVTKRKVRLKSHSLKHKDPSKVTMYKCDSCSYQTKYKSVLRKHLLKHRNPSELTVYQCDSCFFQTNEKSRLQKHSLKHKDPSEVTMYKCDNCSYQSKRKGSLKLHMLTHKDPSEVTMYKCDYCSYQSKHKGSLKVHMLTHNKDPSGVTMYKCYSCSYQSKHKSSLKVHMLTHNKDPSKVTMYKCDYCSYQSKHKGSLKVHMLTHNKDPSEVTMYKCSLCSFQTNLMRNVEQHMLTHKDPSQVTMYKCSLCSFRTNLISNIKQHMLTHKDPSQVTMYKCSLCSFRTNLISNIEEHMLTHKYPSEITMYKCDSCSYQTKYKTVLKSHLLSHRDPSQVTIYKCDSCSYQSKNKYNLKRHLLTHKDPSEITMYTCDSCLFRTKYKRSLEIHSLKHEDPSQATMAGHTREDFFKDPLDPIL